jgi:excisionase family DNA binding protein
MEEKEFLTYEEAMNYLGCKRSTLYSLIVDLDVPTYKFKRDKRRYLALADVKRLKELREKPWLGNTLSDDGEDAA